MAEEDEIKLVKEATAPKAADKPDRRQRQRKKPSNAEHKFRIVVRRLPASMTEAEFLEQVSPLPDVEDFYFAPPDLSLGSMATTRAYMTFKKQEEIYSFRDQFDGYVFVDSKGAEWPAMVEFSPFQGFRGKRVTKKDPKEGTIESDPHYLAFVEKLKVEAEAKPQEGNIEFSFKLPEQTEIKTTPLLEYLENKKAEKNAEKKRKIDERKKRRDDERHKKKQQVEKAIPAAIREEKSPENTAQKPAEVDDNGIMVRVVPSRLDRNQRQKVNEEKREAKREKERERNRERKERRQERREKENAERKNAQQGKSESARSEPEKSEETAKPKPAKPVRPAKPVDTPNPDASKKPEAPKVEATKKREVKKYSERRKEIRERAEIRRQAEEKEAEVKDTVEKETADNATKREIQEESNESWVYKESSGSEDKGRRIRNKDRPSLQIYQPRRQRLAANFDGAKESDERERKSSKEEKPERKGSKERKNSTKEKTPDPVSDTKLEIPKDETPKAK